jgi:hypothetical protein
MASMMSVHARPSLLNLWRERYTLREEAAYAHAQVLLPKTTRHDLPYVARRVVAVHNHTYV